MKEPKRYTPEEQDDNYQNTASEPAPSYATTDIHTLKKQIMEQISKTDNPEILEAVEDLLFELSMPEGTKSPCQFTIEELKEEIRKSEEQIDAGNVISWEDFKKEWDTW